jgi:NADH dehydrogenase FAD-containing subunit
MAEQETMAELKISIAPRKQPGRAAIGAGYSARSLRFSGLCAWFMWRGIYLSKLPGLERKIRVLMDWTIELFFPRDIVQTISLK